MQSAGHPNKTQIRGANEDNPEESRITCGRCRGHNGHDSGTREKRQAKNQGKVTHTREGCGGPCGQGGQGRGRARSDHGRGLQEGGRGVVDFNENDNN
jgi:hypothetical protein